MYIEQLPYSIEIIKNGVTVYRFSTIDEERAKETFKRIKVMFGNDGYTAKITKDFETKTVKL